MSTLSTKTPLDAEVRSQATCAEMARHKYITTIQTDQAEKEGLALAMAILRLPRLPAISLHVTRRAMSTRPLSTAACLIIGDEVLNGKIRDTNSYAFAKYCFEIGLDLRRVEVISDDEDEIVDATQRMAKDYDFVITSGGLGPTHDDITYQSIAKAFNLPLVLHEETVERMKRLGRRKIDPNDLEAVAAQMRMATLPKGNTSTETDIIYVDNYWVPVVCVASKVYILPGIPQLFEALLFGIRPYIVPRIPASQRKHRLLVATRKAESEMASYLTKLQERVNDKEIKIGSYPHMSAGINTVSFIGKEEHLDYMKELVKETEGALEGRQVTDEEEAKLSLRCTLKASS
ncbi:MoaB/Mog domain-containing protein [Lipomyces kononenkoae]|uniref:MoaB/Mog domain-containing protein n=1 Tax=Lipomyces kononenkoae TaxID=34357 RepID=A0ACC3STC3_LIPKO